MRIRQTELAKRLGANDTWVSVRLRGAQPIDLDDLSRIAKALGVPVLHLLPDSIRGSGGTTAEPTRRYPTRVGPPIDPLAPRVLATIGATPTKGPAPRAFPMPRPPAGQPTPTRPGTRVTRTTPTARPLTPSVR